MGICTLIAIVSCRQSDLFFEPTIEWACGRIVLNSLLVLDQVEDKEAFEWAYDLVCPVDFDGEDLWWNQGRLSTCSPRPRPALVVDWSVGRTARTPLEFIGAVCGAIRKGVRALGQLLSEPVCGYAPVVVCNEGRPGLHARPLVSSRRASVALHSIMLDGRLIHRNEVDEECEWLGTDGRFAAEAEQWYDDYTGVGQSSCETEGFRRPVDTTHVDRSGRVTHVRHDVEMVMVEGPLLPGWERGEDNSVTKTETYKRVTSSKRWEKQRSEDRRLARRIKKEVLGC